MTRTPTILRQRAAHERQAGQVNDSVKLDSANENLLLSALQFLCAHTNRSIKTGIWTDHQALAVAQARGCVMCLPCPHCGMTHSFTMADALLYRSLRWEDGVDSDFVDCLPIVAAGPGMACMKRSKVMRFPEFLRE